MELFHSGWTALSLMLFVGIWIWAFSGKRRDAFRAAERMPLEDDDKATPSRQAHQGNER